MTWRIMLGKLSFPLLVGVVLMWCLSALNARQRQAEAKRIGEAVSHAVDQQAAYDAKRVAQLVIHDYTDCRIKAWGEKPVDVDGDPRHAREVLWTTLLCDEGSFTMRGRLPQLMTQR